MPLAPGQQLGRIRSWHSESLPNPGSRGDAAVIQGLPDHHSQSDRCQSISLSPPALVGGHVLHLRQKPRPARAKTPLAVMRLTFMLLYQIGIKSA
jgi:hypothetical protein